MSKLNKFYISEGGSKKGPFSFSDLEKRLLNQESFWTDFVFDEALNEWVMFIQHPEFAKHVPSTAELPKVISHPKFGKYKEKEWYVLKDTADCGPFSKLEIIQLIQSGLLHHYDFIFHESLGGWKSLSEVHDFSEASIKDMLKSQDAPEISESFFKRKHPRVTYNSAIIVHDNLKVYKGKGIEISAGGAGIYIEHPNFKAGQKLYLHFKPTEGVPPFNAVCEIVSVKTDPSMDLGTTRYGIKFVSITQDTKDAIVKYTYGKGAA